MSSDQKKIGSLKDRIARFDNPDAEPVVPRTSFGYGGPARKEPGNNPGKGLIGNRIPSYNARNVPPELFVAGKKTIENRGLYGNRISGVSDHERHIAIALTASTGTVGTNESSYRRNTGQPSLEDRCSQPVEGSSRLIVSTGGEPVVASNLSIQKPNPLLLKAPVSRATETGNTKGSYDTEVDLPKEAGVADSTTQQPKYNDQSDLGITFMEEVMAPILPGAIHQSDGTDEITSRLPEDEEGSGCLLVDAAQNVEQPASLSSPRGLVLPSSFLPSGGAHVDALRPSGPLAVCNSTTPSLEDIRVPVVEGPETRTRVESEDQQLGSLLMPRRFDRETGTSRAGSGEPSITHPEPYCDTAVENARDKRCQSIEAESRDKAVESHTVGYINPEQPAVDSPVWLESDNRIASAEQDPVKGAAGFHEDFVKTRKGQYEIQAHRLCRFHAVRIAAKRLVLTAPNTMSQSFLAIDVLLNAASASQIQEARRALSQLKENLKNANAYLPRYDQNQYQQVSIS
jgi:hypothetical protein